MYPNLTDADVRLRTNANLREYARLEFGPGYAEWLLSEARRAARPATRPRRRTRFFTRKASAKFRPLPHRGSPRGPPFEATTKA